MMESDFGCVKLLFNAILTRHHSSNDDVGGINALVVSFFHVQDADERHGVRDELVLCQLEHV